MTNKKTQQQANASEATDRRDVGKKLGKFPAYAAPFSVLAFTQKAAAATGHGPGKHP